MSVAGEILGPAADGPLAIGLLRERLISYGGERGLHIQVRAEAARAVLAGQLTLFGREFASGLLGNWAWGWRR